MKIVNSDEILLEIAHKFEDKYGVKPGIFHKKGQVLFERIGSSVGPIIPDEVGAILKQVGEKFNLRTGDLAFTTNNGNLLITLTDFDKYQEPLEGAEVINK